MKYKKLSHKEKLEAVEAVNSGMRIVDVAKILGVSEGSISYWMAKDEFNPNKEYVKMVAERKGQVIHAPKDPLPKGIEMAKNKDPQELERELRDLRKKNAYLEDKVAYLQALYDVIKESPETISKKNDAGQSQGLSKTDTQTLGDSAR